MEVKADSQIPQHENDVEKPPIPPKAEVKKAFVYSRSNISYNEEEDESIANPQKITSKAESRDYIQFDRSNMKPSNVRKATNPTYPNWKKNESKPNTPKFSVNYVRIHGPDDGAYKNDSEPRGLIFMKNFLAFDDNQFEYRSGSQKDYDSLLHLFEEMGYKWSAKCCESGHITKDKLFKDLKAFSEMNHNYFSSSIFVIMSHGVKDKTFVTSDNEEVDLMDIYSMFNNVNCNGLKNKPKIFILHFCRPNTNIPMSPTIPNIQSISDMVDERVKTGIEQLRGEIVKDIQLMINEKFRKYEMQHEAHDAMNMLPSDLQLNSSPSFDIQTYDNNDSDSNTDDDCG